MCFEEYCKSRAVPPGSATKCARRQEVFMIAALPQVGEYRLERISLAHAGDSLLATWKVFREHNVCDAAMHDPEWLRGYFEGQANNLFLYSLYDGGAFRGMATFLL